MGPEALQGVVGASARRSRTPGAERSCRSRFRPDRDERARLLEPDATRNRPRRDRGDRRPSELPSGRHRCEPPHAFRGGLSCVQGRWQARRGCAACRSRDVCRRNVGHSRCRLQALRTGGAPLATPGARLTVPPRPRLPSRGRHGHAESKRNCCREGLRATMSR